MKTNAEMLKKNIAVNSSQQYYTYLHIWNRNGPIAEIFCRQTAILPQLWSTDSFRLIYLRLHPASGKF